MRGFQSRGNYSTYVLFLEVFSSNSFRVILFVGWVAIVNPAIPLPPFTIQTRSQITVAAVGLSSLLFSPISFHLSCRELACLFQLSIYRDGKFSVCQRFAGFNPLTGQVPDPGLRKPSHFYLFDQLLRMLCPDKVVGACGASTEATRPSQPRHFCYNNGGCNCFAITYLYSPRSGRVSAKPPSPIIITGLTEPGDNAE